MYQPSPEEMRQKAKNIHKYFKKVELSVSAAAKMLNHAVFGQPEEVMGLLQGYVKEERGNGVFVINDIISLPV